MLFEGLGGRMGNGRGRAMLEVNLLLKGLKTFPLLVVLLCDHDWKSLI